MVGFGCSVAQAMDAGNTPVPDTYGIPGSARDEALRIARAGGMLTETQRQKADINEHEEAAARAAGAFIGR